MAARALRVLVRLDASQHSLGFLTQSAFTGLAQTLAYLSPSILVWLGMDRDRVFYPTVVIVVATTWRKPTRR